jgi:translation initiation factor 1A
MSRKKREQEIQQKIEQQIARIKLPRNNQCLGVVEQRLGGSRMKVRCLDGKPRICRIPGRLKRTLWVREGDIIIVQPWELSGETKGDIVYKYTKSQKLFLKRKGYLSQIEEFEEF